MRRTRPSGRGAPAQAEARRFWGDPDALADTPAPVEPNPEPDALVQFLGPPALPGVEGVAPHYLSAVYEKAVGLAAALATAGGLLRDDAEEPPSGA